MDVKIIHIKALTINKHKDDLLIDRQIVKVTNKNKGEERKN